MSADAQNPIDQIGRALDAWHSTHPDATLAEIEVAVEDHLNRLRTHLLQDRTTARAGEGHPVCPQCGATMLPRASGRRTVIFRGDQQLDLERCYVVCPQCGAGLFPPG